MTDNDNPYDGVYKRIDELNSMIDIDEILDSVSKLSGIGSEDSKFQHIFGGLNRLPNAAPVPLHKEIQGMTLFTRPDLNLDSNNLINLRPMLFLLTDKQNSIPYAIRHILDPELDVKGSSSLIDHYSPYISLLSNTLISMSQPPDIGISTYSSPEGINKEQWIMNEGIAFFNGRYDITCTFDNIKGGGTLMLFYTWLMYMSYLRIGPIGGLVPKADNVFYGRMDYFTRIERYTFDETGRFIEQYWHAGAAMPTNISIGAGFGFNREETHSQENKQISVQFSCVGAVYQDPIQLHEFNLRHYSKNAGLEKSASSKGKSGPFVKLEPFEKARFNYIGTPHIDLKTLEMEWYVPRDHYNKVTEQLKDNTPQPDGEN